MPKFKKETDGIYVFHCPGCGDVHTIQTEKSGAQHPQCWEFNEDIENPTVSPSLLVRSGHYVTEYKTDTCWCDYAKKHPEEIDSIPHCYRCHFFIKNGMIQFLSDCTHPFKDKTVEIPDFELNHPNWR